MEISYHWFNRINIVKLVFVLFLLAIFSMFIIAPALAQDQEPIGGESYQDYINRVGAPPPTGLQKAFDTSSGMPLDAAAVQGGGFNTSVTFEIIVSAVLTMVLGLMGVIFLILAIYGGFKWMTAAGNEEAVEKAKKTIVNAVIGIVIVLAAYAMVRLIVEVIGSKVFK